jgi:hypothetical protein
MSFVGGISFCFGQFERVEDTPEAIARRYAVGCCG